LVSLFPHAAPAAIGCAVDHLLRVRYVGARRRVRRSLEGRHRDLGRAAAMSAHSIGGLVALNVILLVVGSTTLYALRGFRSWNEVLRLGGVAYMLGVAVTGVLFVLELVVGLSLSLPAILVTEAALAGAGLLTGRLLGRPAPG